MRSLLPLVLLVACQPEAVPTPAPSPAETTSPTAAPPVEEPAVAVDREADAGEGARAKPEPSRDAALDRAVAESSGVLGALEDGKPSRGVVGQKENTQAFGSRGVGLGGGGTSQGLGGLGTRGIGSGKSGYGSGGGSFGRSVRERVALPAANTEHYTDYGIHGTTLAADDRFSTFSIDVDTASYAISRSHLTQGSLPPHAAVRVEEFVNAQDYGYVPPDGEAPFSVSMEASPDPWHPGHHVLRVGVKAAEPAIDRLPVHLTFLVDTSGSMRSQNKLPLARRALKELVRNLDGEDRVALVTYAGSTRVVLEPTRVSDRARILAAIDELTFGGGTNMGSGMELAYELAQRSFEPGTENRVVVLSDGDANIGRTSVEQIHASLERYAKRGITMSTIGFGRGNYKDTLMEQLANKGDGNYFYIDTFAEAQKVFGTKLTSTVQTVARDVKLQVEIHPESVLSYRLIGYENREVADRDFRNDAVDAGEIGSGHSVTALYDVVLRDDPADTLVTIRVRSKAPGPDTPSVERATRLPTVAVHEAFTSTTPDFRVALGTAAFAEKLRGSPWAEELDWNELARVVEDAGRGTDAELVGLIRRAGSLSERTVAVR